MKIHGCHKTQLDPFLSPSCALCRGWAVSLTEHVDRQFWNLLGMGHLQSCVRIPRQGILFSSVLFFTSRPSIEGSHYVCLNSCFPRDWLPFIFNFHP